MVLTHLILNDMVKVKGQISELAICIVDDDHLIANRAKLFFSELGKKVRKVVHSLFSHIKKYHQHLCAVILVLEL